MPHFVSLFSLPILTLFLFGYSDKGEDVNRTLEGGRKPLHYAADCGQLEILEFLLLKGADINVCIRYTLILNGICIICVILGKICRMLGGIF